MVGLVVVSHGNLGSELIKVAELIVGKLDGAESVSVNALEDVDRARDEIAAAIKKVHGKNGVLVLTDMFGGTPSNLSLAFLDEDNIEVLTGVNLPMIIKYANHRKEKPLSDLVPLVQEGGLKSIIVASEMLHQKVKK
jgi:PTS system mannose-specific IIA component